MGTCQAWSFEILVQQIWDRNQSFAFLTSSGDIAADPEITIENHWSKISVLCTLFRYNCTLTLFRYNCINFDNAFTKSSLRYLIFDKKSLTGVNSILHSSVLVFVFGRQMTALIPHRSPLTELRYRPSDFIVLWGEDHLYPIKGYSKCFS